MMPVLTAWLTLSLPSPARHTQQHVRRVALVVGANAAMPGRSPLRYAHLDAERFAATLIRVGGFDQADVRMLYDPTPDEVFSAIDALDARVGNERGDVLATFYFSGHADERALFPAGRALPLTDLRNRIDRFRATIKLGIVDACRGGHWTHTKGLSASAPVTIPLELGLASEGTAFVSSSSGVEDAHEAEALKGSFFTHHLIGGLSGAADKSADGDVSLAEAFAYAQEHTIRDTARYAPELQHPSFEVNLRGRQDLVLAQVATSPSVVDIEQERGPIELIELTTGIVILEASPGKRALKLSVAPGRYLLRRRDGERTYAKELTIKAEQAVAIAEDELELVGHMKLALKGDVPVPRVTATTTRARTIEIRYAMGGTINGAPNAPLYVGIGRFNFQQDMTQLIMATWGLTDRLSWQVGTAAFAYRLGEPGAFEIVPRGGLTGWGWSSSHGWQLSVGAGADARVWLLQRPSQSHSLIFNLDATSRFGQRAKAMTLADTATGYAVTQSPGLEWQNPSTWVASGSVGYSVLIKNFVSLNFGLGLSGNVLHEGRAPSGARRETERDLQLSWGSMQSLGFRPLPLVQFHVLKWMSVDLYASRVEHTNA